MIGIDTNVLLPLVDIEDDPEQTAAAQKLVRLRAPVFLNPIVLAEFAWTLRSIWKFNRKQVHDRLVGILDSPEFTVMLPMETRRALEKFRSGPADFADYLIGESNLGSCCDCSYTFDEPAIRKNPAFRSPYI
jgi:predicted nucleic-acid-binding protein